MVRDEIQKSGGLGSLGRRVRLVLLGRDSGIVRTVQFIALAITVVFTVILFVTLMLSPSFKTAPWDKVGLVSFALLVLLWVRGYRLGRFPLWSLVAESTLLFVACATYEPSTVGSLAGLACMLRCMYGAWSRRILLVVVWLAASTGGFSFQEAMFGFTSTITLAGLFGQGMLNFTLFGGIGAVLFTILNRHECNVARDRVILTAGSELVAAHSREHIHRVVVHAAGSLLDMSSGCAFIAQPDGDGLMVTMALESASNTVGMRVAELPPVVVEALAKGEPARVAATNKEDFLHGLEPIAGRTVDAVVMSLSQPGEPPAVLIVTSNVTLSKLVLSGLAALNATVTLALRSVALTEDLRRQAFEDALTGLANRALFRDRLAAAVDRVHSESGRMALLLLDLDGFKAVNDTFGHSTGDQLLMIVADRLRTAVRPTDTVARLGGDEFTIVLDDVTDDTVMIIAQRVLTAIQVPIDLDGAQMSIGCSIGIAQGDRGMTAETLLIEADLAMYRAKAAGKGCYAVYQPEMTDKAVASH